MDYSFIVETSFEEALTRRNVIAAWDLDAGAERTIAVFDLTGGGTRLIASKTVVATAVSQLTHELEGRGVRVGRYDGYQPFVWLEAPDGVTVWSADGIVLRAHDSVVTDRIDRSLSTSEIAAIVGYLDDGYVDRGLKAEKHDGSRVTILYDLSMAASNPTYNRNDVIMDTGWIHSLGTALARWAKVPYRDEV